MQKLSVAACVILVGLLVTCSPATARPWGVETQASGPLRGTSTFQFGAGCDFVRQTFDATFTPAQGGSGTFHLDGCVEIAGAFTFTGTFTMETPRGALTGGVTGRIVNFSANPCPSSPGIPASFLFELTPTVRALSLIRLKGTWCSAGVPDTPGPIFGSVL